VILTKIK